MNNHDKNPDCLHCALRAATRAYFEERTEKGQPVALDAFQLFSAISLLVGEVIFSVKIEPLRHEMIEQFLEVFSSALNKINEQIEPSSNILPGNKTQH